MKRRAPLALLALGIAVAVPGAASGQTPPSTVVGTTANLVPNGGFDVGDRSGHPLGWAVDGAVAGATIVNVAAGRTAGLGSLQLVDTAGNTLTVTSQRIVAAPGAEYTLTARLKVDSGTPAALQLVFTSFDNVVLDTKVATPAAGAGWQTVTVTGIAAEKTANVSVRIAAAGTDAGKSWWDEVTLKQTPSPYDPRLGTARELFLDDYRIETVKDVGRVVHPATKLPDPIIKPEHPWESSAYIYGSVFKIGGVYRMWYDCNNDVAPGYYLCYAESRDGVRWTKPLGRGQVG